MVRTSNHLTNGLPHSRISLGQKLFKPSELSLVMVRMRELDREFARQTKQLTALTKRLQRRITNRLDTTHRK